METRVFTQTNRNLFFRHQDAVFNYRIAAIFRRDSHVLLHRAGTDDFWALPGGRPHHFESAREALRREMREEFGEEARVGTLAAVIEVVFETTHEVNLCFRAELPAGSRLRDLTVEHEGEEEGIPLVFKWIPIVSLHTMRVLPRPVAAAITSMSDGCDYWFDDERPGLDTNYLTEGMESHMTERLRFDTAEECRGAGITYHLTPADVWERQKTTGLYLPEAFEQDGFIHTTNGLDPLLEVANLFYQGDTRDYRVLVLSVPEINADVRYDDENRIYPHIYGALNTSAVIGELAAQRGDDGAFLGFA